MRGPARIARGSERQRWRLDVTGAVQGVGFRPFVHRLAVGEGLGGFVCNTGAGVSLEVEGPVPALQRFLGRLDAEIAPPAAIHGYRQRPVPAQGERLFRIAPSPRPDAWSAVVLPDIATCPDCLAEIQDPADRRYRYPFTTCARCGPRYSVIEAVPYDRVRTTMRHFPLCPACRAEYDDPASRRFHAETIACPACGPQIALWNRAGNPQADAHQAIVLAADAIRQGRIVAVKGLGGFQLLADARNDAAVRRLRARKARPAKPFAVMVPGFAGALAVATVAAEEAALLCAAAAPIVLLRAKPQSGLVAPSVAPSNPSLGVMLPCTPLHHLLMRELGFPVVATSGNRGCEPIVIDEGEAVTRLDGLADMFLVHDRPIRRRVDDSVVRLIAGRITVLRHARGYAPRVLSYPPAKTPVLALGGQQKSALAIAAEGQIVLGPHIGDLGSVETNAAYAQAIPALAALHGVQPKIVAHDTHPGYHGTRIAATLGRPVQPVPHHLAHVLAGMVDNGLEGPVLGIAWDGTGHGADGTIWGGECLRLEGRRYRRAAHLLPFRLPGGEIAVREPRRAAIGVLHAMHGAAGLAMTRLDPVAAFTPNERQVLATMLARGLNAPQTSSAGRLFDAVAAILGLCQKASFEGEAAMAVEYAADRAAGPFPLAPATLAGGVLDWRPVLRAMTAARLSGIPAENLAASFHDALADAIVLAARQAGIRTVLLTGGCFQNARLAGQAVVRLREAGFDPYWHHLVPPNDGGLAVGQAAFAARKLLQETR